MFKISSILTSKQTLIYGFILTKIMKFRLHLRPIFNYRSVQSTTFVKIFFVYSQTHLETNRKNIESFVPVFWSYSNILVVHYYDTTSVQIVFAYSQTHPQTNGHTWTKIKTRKLRFHLDQQKTSFPPGSIK